MKLLLLFISVVTTVNLGAQTGSLKGKIVSEKLEPLAGISVSLEGIKSGASTDEEGNFLILKIKPGIYTLQATGIGYTVSKRDVEITEGSTTELTLKLNIATKILEDVIVTGNSGSERYNQAYSSIGSKIPGSLLDLPQSAAIVTRQVLNDRQVVLLQDAFKNVAGVNQNSASTDYTFRGFNNAGFNDAGGGYALNGLRGILTDYTQDISLVNIERVEFLKGPASILYGLNSPGGLANLVTKKPLKEQRVAASVAYGTFNRTRIEADITGPLSKDKKLLYRFNAGFSDNNDQRPLLFHKNFTLAPSLSYQVSDKDNLRVEFVYNAINRSAWYDWGIPAPNGDFNAVPLEYTPHEPSDLMKGRNYNAAVYYDHRFTGNISFNSAFIHAYSDANGQAHAPQWDGAVPDADNNVARNFRKIYGYNKSSFITNYFTFKINTEKIRHNIIAGVDAMKSFRGGGLQQSTDTANGVPRINIYNPQYHQASIDNYTIDYSYYSANEAGMLGGYITDRVDVLKNLKLLLGARYDRHWFAPVSVIQDKQKLSAILPTAGLVYQPRSDWSVYVSYGTSFEPQWTQDPAYGGPFDPQYGKQVEAGIKFQSRNGKFSASTAIYQLKRTNELVFAGLDDDPATTLDESGFYKTIGESTSKGMELDIMGNITDDWSIVANYAYNDTRITDEADASKIGEWYNNAPYHLGNIWTKYNIPSGKLKGLGVGIGGNAVGSYKVGYSWQPETMGMAPGYAVIDASVFYRVNKTDVSLYLNNVFDKRYFWGGIHTAYMHPGLPRNIMLRIAVTY